MPLDDSPPDDLFEERLGNALHRTGNGFDPDRRALAAKGEARGRRLRSRRRIAVTGSVAGLALVGVGGALLLPGTDAGRAPVAAATSKSGTEKHSRMSAADMIRALERTLPKGRFSEETGRPTDHPLGPYAYAVYDDGHGKAAVSVAVSLVDPAGPEAGEAVTCPDRSAAGYDACHTSTLRDGSRLMIFQGYEYPDRRADTKYWYAQLLTPTGRQVTVSEWNAAAEKDSPVTRPEPPLSPAGLKQAATAAVWRTAAGLMPKPSEPAAPTTTPHPAADGEAVLDQLVSLLPADVTVTSRGADDQEYAWVVVDDGKGRSLVQINVQPNMGDVEGQLFGGAETLPDGTKVATKKAPGEKGGAGVVMWTADTIRPDGLRVVVSAFNTDRQDAAATRTAPALTLSELKAIAAGAQWSGLS
ncbi:hypothetical protein [Streptomyces sp. NBC_00687]|uniref:hypothetical protein n=1 Tax=Streptomyces sp. NBC_00687 TaxID=2975807 RepID=UPI002256A61F|nr:hypothetical protein [Streptomyces sp. NBC_00687]MCX4916717.1 hypothetical protein [Streptomyces sp. NBC_00687]